MIARIPDPPASWSGHRLEVRCCCQPQKLLGWIDWPVAGRRFRFASYERSCDYDLTSARAGTTRAAPVSFELAIEPFWDASYSRDDEPYISYRYAVRAEHVPLDVLVSINGFTRA